MITNEPKLYKETYEQARNYEIFHGVSLVGLVSGESITPLRINPQDGPSPVQLATANLIENAKKMKATHIFGVEIVSDSNRHDRMVVVYGEAYRGAPQ